MEYLDFDLHIAQGTGGHYPVSVVKSPAGEAKGTMQFPFEALALESQLKSLELAVLKSASLRRELVVDGPERKPVEQFGREIFEALFTEDVQLAFRRSQDSARTAKKGLRVRLRVDAPDLSALPWEFLYDTSSGDFVCLSSETPVVRYLEFSRPPEALTVQPPINVLVMVASPNDRPGLDGQVEIERMQQATATLQDAGLLHIEFMQNAGWRDLQHTLRERDFHIFHFVGHGGFDASAGEGVLAFTNDKGGSHLLGATEVGSLLADERSLRLVVLNACLGARGNETDVFSSTSATLVRRGVPAVVAMQYEISDLAAIEFSRSLYEAIADGMPIDASVAEARKAVRLSARNSVEWGTPVLHMRSPDGALFNLDTSRFAARPKSEAAPVPPAPSVSARSPVSTPASAAAPTVPGETVPLVRQPWVLAGVGLALVLAVLWFAFGPSPPPPVDTGRAIARAYLQAVSGGDGATAVAGVVDFGAIGCTDRTVWEEDGCQQIVFEEKDGKTWFMNAIREVETGQDWRNSNIESLLPADDMTRIMTDPHYQSTQDLFGYMSTPGNGWYSNNEGPGRAKESLREYMAAMDTAR